MSVQNYRVYIYTLGMTLAEVLLQCRTNLFVFCVHEKIVPVFYLKIWSSHCVGARDKGHVQI